MSLFDKAKEFVSSNPDKVKDGLDKVGDKVDSATGGKYSDQIDSAKEKAGDYLGDEQEGDQQQGGEPGQPGEPGGEHQGGGQPGQP